MRHEESWQPSKYVQRRGTLRASRIVNEVGVASRLVADLVAERYSRYLPQYARGRLVDLGCGKVPLYGAYKPLVNSVTCVDWENSVHVNPHLDVRTSLAERLPFDARAFDTIILSDVLEHVAEPSVLWDEMARILAPGGHLILNVPFLYCIHESPHDYYRYTSFALRRFAEMRGLTVSVLETVGGGLDVVADTIGKQLQVIPIVGSVLARCVQGTASWFGRTGIGRKIALTSGRVMPLGYFMVVERPMSNVE
jgi:2-polyprenyl-3-methyl-5-hydroxy-6-metoxy-1,4-benzoquinol methylase